MFLRLRKAVRAGTTDGLLHGRAGQPGPGQAVRRAAAHRCPAARPPRCATRWPTEAEGASPRGAAPRCASRGAVILAGERLAEVPGALTAVVRAGRARPGRSLAWIPRRAGERGAIEAGRAARPAARRPRRHRRGRPRARSPGPGASARCRPQPGRDTAGILAAAASGELSALLSPEWTRPTCPTRTRRWPRWPRPASWSAWNCGSARSPTAPTWCSRSPRWPRRRARS